MEPDWTSCAIVAGMDCPFCNEPDFDAIGLKIHLVEHCEAYRRVDLTMDAWVRLQDDRIATRIYKQLPEVLGRATSTTPNPAILPSGASITFGDGEDE